MGGSGARMGDHGAASVLDGVLPVRAGGAIAGGDGRVESADHGCGECLGRGVHLAYQAGREAGAEGGDWERPDEQDNTLADL